MSDVIKALLPNGKAPAVLEKQIDDKIKGAVEGLEPLPPNGVAGQVLVSQGGASATWAKAPTSLPDGGSEGQALVKQKDGTSQWQTVPATQVWDYDAQVKAQGFALIVSASEPAEKVHTTKDGERFPIIWQRPITQLIPTVPETPYYYEGETAVLVPNLVGVNYFVTQIASNGGEPVNRNVAIGEGRKFGLGTLGELPLTLKIEARPEPGYKFPAEFAWEHTFVDPNKRTVITSDGFSGANGTSILGRSTDTAQGGSALAWTGEWNGGTYPAGSAIATSTQHTTVQDGKLVFAAGTARQVSAINVGTRNVEVEFEVMPESTLEMGLTVYVGADAGGSTLSTGLSLSMANPKSYQLRVSIPKTGGSRFEKQTIDIIGQRFQAGRYKLTVLNKQVTLTTPTLENYTVPVPDSLELDLNQMGSWALFRTDGQAAQYPNGKIVVDNLKISKVG